MRPLYEISRPRSFQEMSRVLGDKGYQMLGNGYYSTIWERPGAASVLKIMSAKDQAYLDFANMTKQSPNPHFPKLFGKIIRINQEYWAIRMERLQPNDAWDAHSRAIRAYIVGEKGVSTQVANRLLRDDLPVNYEDIDELFGDFPRLKEACDLVIDLAGVHALDCHSDNIMRRGDTPVITDPVANERWS